MGEHEREIKPMCHPALNQQCMARYIFKAFVWPGNRVDYLGKPVELPAAKESDDDWTHQYAPDGVSLKDYDPDMSLKGIVTALMLLPLKLMCPTYSPVYKID